ncbi:hypothetical protein SAMN05216410_3554 [Sanguibacter gelidistatuariae]|uniref:Uncharacterized protein n=1 Tax=Sanguibacter gelidistatuariae TaxID=1814289 RepID=A0A1G6VXX4_9MICO|nr:hypothetical protein [Sanguibacter gelidistatuariae]SDD57817.1 hypothetical protein SAMN05216410_3554 [Sanguibacter gelidistatuariae]
MVESVASPGPDLPAKIVRRRRKTVAPDLPLGSLSQPQGAIVGPLTCTDCASSSLTRLVVANPLGVPAVFVSCHDCERSGWYAVDGGHEVTRDAVVTEAGATSRGDAEPVDAEPVVTPET